MNQAAEKNLNGNIRSDQRTSELAAPPEGSQPPSAEAKKPFIAEKKKPTGRDSWKAIDERPTGDKMWLDPIRNSPAPKLSFLERDSVANVQGLASLPTVRLERKLGRIPAAVDDGTSRFISVRPQSGVDGSGLRMRLCPAAFLLC